MQLDTGMPVANGMLTTDTEEQAQARAAAKGREARRVAVEMAQPRARDRQAAQVRR